MGQKKLRLQLGAILERPKLRHSIAGLPSPSSYHDEVFTVQTGFPDFALRGLLLWGVMVGVP